MRFSTSTVWKWLLAAGAIVVVLSLVLSRSFYSESMLDIFMAVSVASILAIHLAIRPVRDLLPVALIAVVLLAIQRLALGVPIKIAPILCVLGLSSILFLAIQAIRSTGSARKKILFGLIPCCLLCVSDWAASTMLAWTARLHPQVRDLFLYKFDCSLGFQPSFLVGQWFARMHWLWLTCLLFYIALPVSLSLVYGQKLKATGSKALPLFLAFLVTGPLGILLYNLFPALGPIHTFSGFPQTPLTVAQAHRLAAEAIRLPGARNAIPSLHLAWVLLAWWNARDLSRWLRIIAGTFVAMTVLATLGTGEHYLIDLVVACPFALMIHAAFFTTTPHRFRQATALTGATLTLGWLAMLSFGTSFFWLNRSLPWIAVLGTIFGVAWMVHKLRVASLITLPEKSGIGAVPELAEAQHV